MARYSFNGEFSWEILYGVAEAYQLHLSNKLDETNCVQGTQPFYYFSKNHKEEQTRKHGPYKGPSYGAIYKYDMDINNLVFPPYKEYYSQKAQKLGLSSDKPVIVINNKSCIEHQHTRAVNRIELDELELIADRCKDFKIFYLRPYNQKSFPDPHQPSISFEDKEFIKRFSNFESDDQLIEKYRLPFNEVQLLCHSLADHHISVAGGNAILASHFGGVNLVVGKCNKVDARPVWHSDSYLKNISGSIIKRVKHISDYPQLLREHFNV